MNRTAIEWCDYTVNPVKGLCPVACEYCYARRMYKRFKWDETIRWDTRAWHEPVDIDKLSRVQPDPPSRIFVGSTMELFGPWVSDHQRYRCIEQAIRHPMHTFIFLTKRPQELAKQPWPSNCWLGVTAESPEHIRQRGGYGDWATAVQAKVKFISFEPLLGPFAGRIPDGINWVIIGQQTPVRKSIQAEWVLDIIHAADIAGVPVFLKDNLKAIQLCAGQHGVLRQEYPLHA